MHHSNDFFNSPPGDEVKYNWIIGWDGLKTPITNINEQLKYNNMKTTLKTLLVRIMALVFFISAINQPQEINAQRLSRDLNVDLLINQVGYVPAAGKKIVQKEHNGKYRDH